MSSHDLPLWPDNPTAEDLLGFSDVAAPVVGALKRDRLDPVALGIFGDWGSGKTTILEIIQEEFGADETVVVVYTRPWEYDPATDPKATLIAEVLGAVREAVSERQGGFDKLSTGVKDKFKSLAGRIRWSKAITLAANSAISLSPPKFSEVVEIFGADDDPASVEPTLQGFRDEFAELMAELESISRVVVLVDDLDRCLPPSVVGTLEAIKLFLSVPKMGFVLAADRRLVTHAIADQYGAAPQAERMAQQYLEKIVQIPVTVPALGEGDTEAYIALLLIHRHFSASLSKFEQVVAHCGDMRQASKPRVLDELPDGLIPELAKADLSLAAQLAPVLAERLGGNPRRIKRFMNAFWLRDDIARRRSAELEPAALAKLLLLEELEDDQFATLLGWLGAGELKERLAKIEKATSETKLEEEEKPLFAWAHQGPELASKDLGPYLRLAASLRSKPGPRTELRSELQALVTRLGDESATTRKAAQKELPRLQVEDQLAISRELIAAIRAEPNRQGDLAPSLLELAKDDAVASDVAARLQDVDPAAIEPALIIQLAKVRAMRATIAGWKDSGRLTELSAKAAEQQLRRAS